MSESRLNIELFKKVRQKIATAPDAYDQETYGRPDDTAPCGTAACIAGWASFLSERVALAQIKSCNGLNGGAELVHSTAVEVLGLTTEEAGILFTDTPGGDWTDYDDNCDDVYANGWPEPFGDQWRSSRWNEKHQVAVAYLDHIIQTGSVLE